MLVKSKILPKRYPTIDITAVVLVKANLAINHACGSGKFLTNHSAKIGGCLLISVVYLTLLPKMRKIYLNNYFNFQVCLFFCPFLLCFVYVSENWILTCSIITKCHL